MGNEFSEVVITAPFLLTKGFLMGFMKGRGQDFPYFFHRKHGIRHEGVGDLVREFLHTTCHTHLCLPDEIVPAFENALLDVEDKIAAKVESKKQISSATFTFSFHIYNEDKTGACKALFSSLPADVELVDFTPLELRGDAMIGVAEFSKIHQYCYEGNGTVIGDFEGVMNFFLKIKRHTLASVILCSEISLSLK